jgi:hypothetical protein
MRQLVGVFGEREASRGQSKSVPRPPKQDFAELSRGVSASISVEQVRRTGQDACQPSRHAGVILALSLSKSKSTFCGIMEMMEQSPSKSAFICVVL